jgi:hypothetical protein
MNTSLNPSVQSRLNTARMMQLAYKPNETIAEQLRQKSILMMVSPSSCGKSYIMEQAIERDPTSHHVIDMTTRPPRPDDIPGHFLYLPHDDTHVAQYLDRIENKELVQYAVHPTTGYLYGSDIAGYPAEFNMLETLSSMVTFMRTLPFRRSIVIGIVVRPEQWRQWFDARFPVGHEERIKRLDEAIMCLSWLTDTTHGDLVNWVENGPELDPAAAIISIMHGGAGSANGYEIATSMLEWAHTQLVAAA